MEKAANIKGHNDSVCAVAASCEKLASGGEVIESMMSGDAKC
jgi:hypothetical protein